MAKDKQKADKPKKSKKPKATEVAEALSDEERAELEALRAEKAARKKAEQDARERAELEALRKERDAKEALARQARQEAEQDARDAQLRERNRQLMEPDDDLRMPLAQKLVLAVLAFVVAAAIFYVVNGL